LSQTFVDRNEGASHTPLQSHRSAIGAIAKVTIPGSLLRHFHQRGIVLRRARNRSHDIEWIVDNADVGARCEVVTSFVRFPKGTTLEDKTVYLRAISTPSAINENTDLAMFHPHARGTTSAIDDCERWSGKSAEIIGKLVDAFKSYGRQPRRPI
jgi:hypothetical protein